MEDKHIIEIENNLENIRSNDYIYRLKSEIIAEHLPADLKKLYMAIPQLPVIATDTYYIHYSVMPILKTRNNDRVLDSILEIQRKYVASKEYNSIHTITRLNNDLSMVYAIQYTRKFIEAIKNELEKELTNHMKKQQKQKTTTTATNTLQGGSGPTGTQQKTPVQQLSQLVDKALSGDSSARQLLQQLFSTVTATNIQKIMDHATETATRTVKTADNIKKILATGVAKSGTSFDKLLDLADSLVDVHDMDKIISLANKIYAETSMFVKLKKTRVRRGGEVSGYKRTRKIEEALPREIALPDELFIKKIIDGFTAIEKHETIEGAYYVLVDKSGSMTGMKTIWARSVALALFRLARRKKRKYFMRMFDTAVHPDKPLSDPSELLEAILHIESSGGTDITGALRHALEDLAKHKLSQYTNTIIIITDGEDEVDESIVKDFMSNRATLVAVMIAGENHTLRNIAEKTGGHYLKAHTTEDGALKILEVVSRK